MRRGASSSQSALAAAVIPSGPAALYASAHSLPAGQPYVLLHTLNKTTLTIAVNSKCRVSDILKVGCQDTRIAQSSLFGIAIRVPSEGLGGDSPRNEYLFLNPDHLLHKYIGKRSKLPWLAPKSDNTKRLALYLRVIVYVEDIRLITCCRALEHYYIQLKENMLDQWAGTSSVSEERSWEMAALAMRADKGDCPGGTLRAEQYFPLWIIESRGLDFVRRHMPKAVADLAAVSQSDAMRAFCQEAARPPYSVNSHVYGMRRHKLDTVDRALLAITPRGLSVSAVSAGGEKCLLCCYPWSRIARIAFDRRCLAIAALGGPPLHLYAQNEAKTRQLLSLCRTVHRAQLAFSSCVLPRITEYAEKCVDDGMSASTSGIVSDCGSKDDEQELEDDCIILEEDIQPEIIHEDSLGFPTRSFTKPPRFSRAAKSAKATSAVKKSTSSAESYTQTTQTYLSMTGTSVSYDSQLASASGKPSVPHHDSPSPSPEPPTPVPAHENSEYTESSGTKTSPSSSATSSSKSSIVVRGRLQKCGMMNGETQTTNHPHFDYDSTVIHRALKNSALPLVSCHNSAGPSLVPASLPSAAFKPAPSSSCAKPSPSVSPELSTTSLCEPLRFLSDSPETSRVSSVSAHNSPEPTHLSSLSLQNVFYPNNSAYPDSGYPTPPSETSDAHPSRAFLASGWKQLPSRQVPSTYLRPPSSAPRRISSISEPQIDTLDMYPHSATSYPFPSSLPPSMPLSSSSFHAPAAPITISRVQSVPARPMEEPARACALAVAASSHRGDPPSYARALELRQQAAGGAAGASAECAGRELPAFPLASLSSAYVEEAPPAVVSPNQLRHFPMMHALWVDNLLLSSPPLKNGMRSSLTDIAELNLAGAYGGAVGGCNHHGEYMLDEALSRVPQSQLPRPAHSFGYAGNQVVDTTTVLPPPPPYPTSMSPMARPFHLVT